MEDFISISLLSLAMLVGCYFAGTIPLAVNFSEVRDPVTPPTPNTQHPRSIAWLLT